MSDKEYDSATIDDEAVFSPSDDVEEFEDYRSISKYAVFSMIMAIVSIVGLLFPAFAVFGLTAIVLGIMAKMSIRRYPKELTGSMVATLGIFAGGTLFVSAASWHTYDYMTEVPEGYERVTWYDLQPDEKKGELVSGRAVEVNGKKVFVKGYVHPGVDGQGFIDEIVLVRDMGTCCFGGQPKLTDMMEVTLRAPLKIRYSMRRRKLGGLMTLVAPRRGTAAGDLDSGYYQLEADYLK